MKAARIILLLFPVFFISCKEKEVPFRTNDCKGSPLFIQRLAGFDYKKSYFSTSEIRTMGLVLVENSGSGEHPSLKYYQHPSWRKGGWLSPIQLDNSGNIYSSSAPFINMLNNPVEGQNTIFKIDAVTGEMNEFIKLPLPDSLSSNNPYGVLGLLYYCEGGVLFAATVAGSDRHVVRGGIYAIDVKTKKIIDQIGETDAIGMGVSYITGKRCLYFGTGRNSDVFSVEITEKGTFSGKPEKIFSLATMGPRGDDKVRRIQTNPDGSLLVHGFEFNYNLIAPKEKPETVYQLSYDQASKKWFCTGIINRPSPI